MKKIILLLIFLLSILMCSKKEDGQTEATAGEQKLPDKIIVGLDDTFAPMGFRDEKGELVGFDIDLAKAVAEKLGIEVQFQPINWDSKEMELKSKVQPVLIRVDQPYLSFTKVLEYFNNNHQNLIGTEAPTFIHESASIPLLT